MDELGIQSPTIGSSCDGEDHQSFIIYHACFWEPQRAVVKESRAEETIMMRNRFARDMHEISCSEQE
jgi:hypothetical protein